MEQSKSPKGLAYHRLGKQLSGKHSVPQQQMKMNRNSTGNIYQELLKNFDTDQNKYIRTLVHKNQKMQKESISASTAAIHNRKKSYADVQPFREKQVQRVEVEVREERDTLCKPKYNNTKQKMMLNQMTPKNNTMTRSDFINHRPHNQHNSVDLSTFIKKQEKKEENFISNLTTYLQTLNQSQDNIKQSIIANHGEKFTETIKYVNCNQKDSYQLASKLEKSLIKIKELKLKNHFVEKELGLFGKKEKKMKECLYQMLEELKVTNSQLAKEKKERKRLQKIIDSFQIKQKNQRKTIGKGYHLGKIQQFQQKINLFTQNEGSDLDSSLRQIIKTSNQVRRPKHDRQYSQVQRNIGILDSNKIDELFKGGFGSQDQESYDQ